MYCTLPPVTGAAELKVSLVVTAFFAVSSAAMTTQFSPVSPAWTFSGESLTMSLRSPMVWSPLTLSGTAAMVKPRSLRSWACGASSVKALAPLVPSPGTVKTEVAPFGTEMALLAFSALVV